MLSLVLIKKIAYLCEDLLLIHIMGSLVTMTAEKKETSEADAKAVQNSPKHDEFCSSNHDQTINNFTKIPNVIFDYWMQILSPPEFKVFMYIWRRIHGWQKQEDSISLRQFMKTTQLTMPTIIKCISMLVDKGLINQIKSKSQDGDNATSNYSVNHKVLFRAGGAKNPLAGGAKNPLATKERLIKERSSSPTPSSVLPFESIEEWRKKMIFLGCREEEFDQAWEKLIQQPPGSVVNVRRWLGTVLQSIRDSKAAKDDLKRREEERYESRRACQKKQREKEAEEARNRARERDQFQNRYKENAELASRLSANSWIEIKSEAKRCGYILLKYKDKSISNLTLSFEDPHFSELVHKFMQKEGH